MLIDLDTTRKNLKALLEREEVNPAVSVSKERRENFKAACDLEGINKVSTVLEDLIDQVIESYFETDKKLKIEIEGFNDRKVTSICCDSKKWEAFKGGCKKNNFSFSDVIEALMGEFIAQVEKSHKVKISNGKVKK